VNYLGTQSRSGRKYAKSGEMVPGCRR